MKFGVVKKSTILNRFVLHTLQRNITHLAVITHKTNKRLNILKGGDWKRAPFLVKNCRWGKRKKSPSSFYRFLFAFPQTFH